jgi:hypothetical protein
MIAFVRGVIAASSFAGSMLYERRSTSTNTGFAPISAIISAVAKNVNGTVITSSPGFTSRAMSAISSASVPLATPMQCFAPTYSASRCSSSVTSGPITYCPCSSTLAIRASTEGFRRRYWVLRSMKSMGGAS